MNILDVKLPSSGRFVDSAFKSARELALSLAEFSPFDSCEYFGKGRAVNRLDINHSIDDSALRGLIQKAIVWSGMRRMRAASRNRRSHCYCNGRRQT
jgi:hypothetical protein